VYGELLTFIVSVTLVYIGVNGEELESEFGRWGKVVERASESTFSIDPLSFDIPLSLSLSLAFPLQISIMNSTRWTDESHLLDDDGFRT